MFHSLCVYDRKGSPVESSIKKIALILGPAQCIDLQSWDQFDKESNANVIGVFLKKETDYDFVLHGITANLQKVLNKPLFLFIFAPDSSMGDIFQTMLVDQFSLTPVLSQIFTDSFAIEEIVDYGIKIKEELEKTTSFMPPEELRVALDEYLNSHDTCALCTGFGEEVRATPIEYNYIDGSFYLLSEGGFKFANLLRNPNVSIAIFDNYSGMTSLAGFQISGQVEFIEIGSAEYRMVLEHKGLKTEKILEMPFRLNLIKVIPIKAEILYSKLRELGYDSKQIYYFEN